MNLPEFLDPEVWNDYDKYRKQISKGKWTQRGKELCIKKITQFHSEGLNVNDIIETTIANGWTGLWAPKTEKKQQTLDNFSSKQYGKSGKI
jgi:hypothetical protein